jgi:hypothetical protein
MDVNVRKTKYTVLSGDHKAGRSHNLITYNNSSYSVEDLKCLVKSLNQNSIQE